MAEGIDLDSRVNAALSEMDRWVAHRVRGGIFLVLVGVVAVVAILLTGSGDGATREDALLHRVARAVGCDGRGEPSSVRPLSGFTDAGACVVDGHHVRVDVNLGLHRNVLEHKLSDRYPDVSQLAPCPDGSDMRPPWLVVGEGWLVTTGDPSIATRASREADGQVLPNGGPPVSFPLPQEIICEEA